MAPAPDAFDAAPGTPPRGPVPPAATPGAASGRPPGGATDRLPGEGADRVPGAAPGRPPGGATDRVPEAAPGRAADRLTDHAAAPAPALRSAPGGAPCRVPVALSTASVYPESTATAFEIAARLGYDGVEVMVWTDPVSQDVDALRRLSDYHAVPILAVHAPCLLITQRVWSTDPWVKLQRARAAAERLGASTVVVHPPFRWQRSYARDFVRGVWRMADETDIRFAVENMYPWRYRDREMAAYAPDWDVTREDYRHFTVDLSHAATSRTGVLEMAARMGDRLAHVHLGDGNGSAKDEHLVPGRGTQPCAELLRSLAGRGFAGHVVVEVNTRRAMSSAEREADLAEALAFARRHLAGSAVPSRPAR